MPGPVGRQCAGPGFVQRSIGIAESNFENFNTIIARLNFSSLEKENIFISLINREKIEKNWYNDC